MAIYKLLKFVMAIKLEESAQSCSHAVDAYHFGFHSRPFDLPLYIRIEM